MNPLIVNMEYHMQVRPRVPMRSVTKSTDVVHIATISARDLKSFSVSTVLNESFSHVCKTILCEALILE
jgi:hypothetical protein